MSEKCRHDVSQDCPACMQEEIDQLKTENWQLKETKMGRAYERDLLLENLNQGPPPDRFYTCEQCGGEGVIYSAGWSYAPGCGYPHEDVEVHECTACNGAGGWIDEAEQDHRRK